MNSSLIAQAVFDLSHEIGADEAFSKLDSYLNKSNLQLLKDQIMKKLASIVAQEEKAQIIHIESAGDISDSECNAIKEAFVSDSKDTPFTHTINPNLKAGFVVTYQGKQHDASLQLQVEKLKQQLLITYV